MWLTKDTEEDEQKLIKSLSLLESQHHHLLQCLEKTTVGTLEHFSIFDSDSFICKKSWLQRCVHRHCKYCIMITFQPSEKERKALAQLWGWSYRLKVLKTATQLNPQKCYKMCISCIFFFYSLTLCPVYIAQLLFVYIFDILSYTDNCLRWPRLFYTPVCHY